MAEERLRMLDAMSQAARSALDPTAIMQIATRMLGRHLQMTRCPYADMEPDSDRFMIRHDWTAKGAARTVGEYSPDLFGERPANEMRQGRTLRLADVEREPAGGNGAAMFHAIDCKAIICCPLVKKRRLVSMMAVHQDRPRHWTEHQVARVEETVERSWARIERVRANLALREADRRKTEFLAPKYTPAGGKIAVAARGEDNNVCVNVSGSGVGIAAESGPTVFEMVSQVGMSMERAQGGPGIGLSLARRLVELHGGRIARIAHTLSNVPPARGRRF